MALLHHGDFMWALIVIPTFFNQILPFPTKQHALQVVFEQFPFVNMNYSIFLNFIIRSCSWQGDQTLRPSQFF
jgi:hypothetical protein